MIQRPEILRWLLETNDNNLENLWRMADGVRCNSVGDEVHLRGLIEISNHCVRRCHYCGLRADNNQLSRYRMTQEEILECAHEAIRFGYGTVVLQAGEDTAITKEWMNQLIQKIKQETQLAITLSLGERTNDELQTWYESGADRYLLRFETSNSALFRQIHPSRPGHTETNRIVLLKTLREIGYEVGSGVMVGIPGQSYNDLANDLELFRELDLDMIGVGPFIPHPLTPLAKTGKTLTETAADKQAPNTELMTYKMVALARLICPDANIPSTTALATLNLAAGRELGLQRGANILMPNLTPQQYRILYEIYPAKACIRETAKQCHGCMKHRIEAIGRGIGQGTGASPNWVKRHQF